MKIPKTFNKMSASDQESWLVKKLMELQAEESKLRRLLATVRGGSKIQIKLDERPDEINLKETA
jgi:hypothetical protein